MKKFNIKSQISMFLIFVLIFVFVIVIAFYFIGHLKEDKAKAAAENAPIYDSNIRNFVQSCVDLTAKNAVFYLGFKGGNLKNDVFGNYFYIDSFYKIPYYYYEGNSFILSEEGFKNIILAKYMNDNLRKCTNNFVAFQNIRIVDANVKTSVELNDDGVIFNIIYPVSINSGFSVHNLDRNYITEVKVRLKDIIAIASHIVADEVENDRYIHWNFLTDVSNRNYNITAYTEDDNTIIYRIIDLENEIDNEQYIFQWANKIKLAK